MAFLNCISWVFKCIFCVEDDEEREQRYYPFHRDREIHTVYAPLMRQNNSGQRISSFKAHSDSYQSLAKSTGFLNTETIGAISGTNASKQPPIPNKENFAKSIASISISGNQPAVNSIESSTASYQFSLASHPLKSPSVTCKHSLYSASEEKRSEIHQKVKSLYSSSTTANIHYGKTAYKAFNSLDRESTVNSGPPKPPSKPDPPKPPPKSQSHNPLLLSIKPTISPETSSSSSSQSKNTYTVVEKVAPSTKPPSKPDPLKSPPKLPPKSQSYKTLPLSTKPTISPEPSRNTYTWVQKDAPSTYVFPQDIKMLIEKDIIPSVLKMPLSGSSYKDYFHALLYAEDCYLEIQNMTGLGRGSVANLLNEHECFALQKWDGFEMKNVKVQLHEAAIYTRRDKNRNVKKGVDDKEKKVFVKFELDKIREKRPFLMSRDFVSLQPTNQKIKPFQGVIYRVVKSNLVLAEFGEEFHFQHHPDKTYDLKFSFNRVCLKRAHQAVAAASERLFRNLLFPNVPPKHEPSTEALFSEYQYEHQQKANVVRQILRLQGLPPYLVEGPLAVENGALSKTGIVVVETILQILRYDPSKKILLCAPINKTCDLLMRGLKKEIPESKMFRANAAFRELDGVPEDILPSCLYKDEMECFACPSLKELKKYKVILTTFMSSFRLYAEGIMAGHFSHIFLVDASSSIEPEAIVPLANFVTEKTVVVASGAPGKRSGWIRSKIARENGLMMSYFERLRERGMYSGLDPNVIVQLGERKTSRITYEYLPHFSDVLSLCDAGVK